MKLLIVLLAVCLVSIYATPHLNREELANNINELTWDTTMEKEPVFAIHKRETFNSEEAKKSYDNPPEVLKKLG